MGRKSRAKREVSREDRIARRIQEQANAHHDADSLVSVTPITRADLGRLDDGYDIFDLMRDNCPHCQPGA
jgi:hypothetical protein